MSQYHDAQSQGDVRLQQICPVCSKSKNRGTFTWLFFAKDRCECKLASENECKLVEAPNPSIEQGNSEESLSLSEKPNIDLGTRYEVIKELGSGAAGTVYHVYDREWKKDLAVKVLRDELASDEGVLARFKQEANLALTLSHENLVGMYGLSTSPKGNPFIVMDLLEGRSLETVLKEDGPLSEERFVSIFTQVLEGLSHAHMKGLIHRDLKPSNIIIIERSPGVEIVKLIDFGIAKLTETSLRTTHNLTESGEVFGTPIYMSPEQCLGFAVDTRADIYSLGCVMYECATGSPPFSGKNAIQIISKHLSQEPADLATIDDRLGELINFCLAKEPGDRPKSAREILLRLQTIELGEKGLSVSFNPSAVKQLVRSKASNVIPSMRLAYGALGLSMWCGLAVAAFFCWIPRPPGAVATNFEILATALFTFLLILSQAARAYIRECSAEIESAVPAQDKLERPYTQKIGTTSLRFQGEPKPELFIGESIRSGTGGVQNTCAVWRDEHDNRIAADFGNTTLMKWDPLAIVKKSNQWLVMLFALFLMPLNLGVAPFAFAVWLALLFLLISRQLYRSMRRGDRLLLPLCGLTVPFVLFALASQTSYYSLLCQQYFPGPGCLWIARITTYYFYLLEFSWLAYGTVRLLEKKGVIRIRNKYLKSANLKPDINLKPDQTKSIGLESQA